MKEKTSKFLMVLAGLAATGVSFADYPGCPVVEPDCACDYMLPDPNNYGVMFGVKGCETKKLIFSGLIQTDYQFIHVEDKANFPANAPAPGKQEPSDINNFLMRRVRFGFEAELGEGWRGVIITDFSGKEKQTLYVANGNSTGSLSFQAADYEKTVTTTNWCHGIFGLYAAYIEKYCSGNFFRAGYKKVNFGREELVEASDLKAIERSIATNYFNGCQLANVASGSPLGLGERHVGIFMDGMYDHFGYGAAITNGYKCAKNCSSSLKTEIGNHTYSPDNELGVYGNLYYMNDFNCIDMELGVNFAYQPKGDNYRLQYNIASNWTPKRGQMFGYNPYVMLKYKGWTLLGEVMGAHIENGGVDGITDVSPFGVTVMPSYMWNDQLELVARASYLDTDHRGVKISSVIHCAPDTNSNTAFAAGDIYGKATAWYAGFNYYMMNKAIKFSAGYEYASFEDRHAGSIVTKDGNVVLDPDGFGKKDTAGYNDKSKVHSVRARVQLVF